MDKKCSYGIFISGHLQKPVLSKEKQIGTVDARKAIEGVLSHSERA